MMMNTLGGSSIGYAEAQAAEVSAPDQGRLPEIANGILAVAQRLASVDESVNAFLNRCNGPMPQTAGETNAKPDRPTGHLGAISLNFADVWAALERLENRVSAFSSIG